jgi:hypothetical protein
LNRRSSKTRSSSSSRNRRPSSHQQQEEEKVAKITSFSMGFRRVTGAGAAAAGGNRRKKVAKITSFSMGFRSYIRQFLAAILMLFRPSLPWGFAAGRRKQEVRGDMVHLSRASFFCGNHSIIFDG